jgi:glycine/D-amino acid oxidase-like deaminating enzyme
MQIDYLIVGQGLAGSILAWELIQHEQTVLVIDNGHKNSASRVAAGLINPITGQRLVKSAEVDQCLPAALDCYRKLEQFFTQQFYFPLPMLRLFRCQAEQDRYRQRCNDVAYQSYLGKRFPLGQSGEPVNDTDGGFEQQHTGYLNIARLLDAMRKFLQRHQSYLGMSFNYQELQLHADRVQWKDYQAAAVIFCEGAYALENPWFRWLPYQLCKGDIITLQSSNPVPAKMINDGYWLLPVSNNTVKVGATYEWQWRNGSAGDEARQVLLQAYQRLTADTQFNVIDHQAGIRPTTKDKHPFIGRHPEQKRLLIFNGFGSKGALWIPYFASHLVQTLCFNKPLPAEVDIDRFAQGNSMVTLAKRFVSEHLRPGDVAIDATVGNGHDTEFLARCVGKEGQVYGFDIQSQAIANTRDRLVGSELDKRVTLYHAGHESMADCILQSLHGKIAAVVFNLGYLPGGDKTKPTKTQSTQMALEQALALLKVGGVISMVVYSGHAAGEEETRGLVSWLQQLNSKVFTIEFVSARNGAMDAPGLIKIIKTR